MIIVNSIIDKLAVVHGSTTSLNFLIIITIVLIGNIGVPMSRDLSQSGRNWSSHFIFLGGENKFLSYWSSGILKEVNKTFFCNILAIENTNIGLGRWGLLLE